MTDFASVADLARQSAENSAISIREYINRGELDWAAGRIGPLEAAAKRAAVAAADAAAKAREARASAAAARKAVAVGKRALAEARRREKAAMRAARTLENDGKHTHCLHLTDDEVEAADRAICEAKRAATGGRA